MFDTVRLGIEGIELDTDKLKKRGWSWVTFGQTDAEGVATEKTIFSPPEVDYPHYLRYLPLSGTLKLETSLPKVCFGGENFRLLAPGDVCRALDDLSNRVSDLTGADIPHCGDWDIRGRCDAVFSWDTTWGGKIHVADYLHAFKSVELPRHYSQAVDREATLYWRNRQRVIRLYDKEKESGVKAARGLLRFEVQLNHAKKELSDVARVPSIKARDALTWQAARSVLQNYLDGLGADLVVTDDEQLFQLLRERCKNTKAIRLIGFVFVSRMYSRDELLEQGYKRNWLWRNAREINRAGASVGASKSGLLPPLTLPREYNGAVGRLV